jgi:hypothetical protein
LNSDDNKINKNSHLWMYIKTTKVWNRHKKSL